MDGDLNILSVHPINSWQFLVLLQDEIGDTRAMVGHMGYDVDGASLLLTPLRVVVKAG